MKNGGKKVESKKETHKKTLNQYFLLPLIASKRTDFEAGDQKISAVT